MVVRTTQSVLSGSRREKLRFVDKTREWDRQRDRTEGEEREGDGREFCVASTFEDYALVFDLFVSFLSV